MQGLKSKPCVPGAHQPRVATSLLERSHQLPGVEGGLAGARVGTDGTGTGEAMRRPSIRAGRRRKGLIEATRNASLTGSLGGGLVSELILNAKREMGVYGEQAGRWEEAGLRSYLDAWLSPELFRTGASKPSASPRGRAAPGTHTKWACIIQVASPLCAARQSVCSEGPSFPKSPLLRIINKQDGSLYSHLAAGRICSHNRKSCACCRKILRDSTSVIDLNSRAPAQTCRTFQQGNADERQRERICSYFFPCVLCEFIDMNIW